ncbi:MAG: FtsX-like permease family protein [Chloroflexota bacterium]
METVFGVSMDVIMFIVLTLSIIVLLGIAFLAWRNPIIFRLALRNIPRRRAQTVLIVLGLMLATLLITAAFGTGDTMTYSMRQAFTAGLGGTDIAIQRVNPVIAIGGPPDFNRPVPTFDQSLLGEVQAKVGSDDRIDGWSVQLQQIGPLIDTDSTQGSGQTFITGVGPDLAQTVGDLHLASGGKFDIAQLKEGDIVLDQSGADKLNAKVGDNINIIVNGKTTPFKVREIVQISSPSTQYPVAYIPLGQMQQIYNAPNQITEIDISLKGGDLEGVQYSKDVAKKIEGAVDTKVYSVNEVKQGGLNTANLIGNLFTTIFLGTALFSIAAGILLIFLIFTMLAAERKSEMGMARAIGTQRGHLTQMFVFEGMAYDLAAAAVGAALGVGVGFAMVGVISSVFNTYGFQLVPHVEARSIIVAYCLGMLVTFATVAISAVRVSRLNIVSAIRDIPDMPKPEQRLLDRLTGSFDMLASGQIGGCIGGMISLLMALFFSGPVAGTLGILLMAAGWAITNGFLFHFGATLFIIGLGFTIRWVLTRMGMRLARRNRIAFTITGLLLIIYWALPIDALHDWFGLPQFGLGIEYFFVAGLAMVAGAVWVVIYNSDLLLGAMTFLLGGVGRMRPVLKTAVAYPMAAIFRTGMAIAMFALIMFVLILMSVLTGINQQVDPNKPNVSGGYQIEAAASYSNPIADMKGQIAANPDLNGKFETVTGQTGLPLQMRQIDPPRQVVTGTTGNEGWGYYTSRLVDQDFLATNGFEISTRAEGYNSDREVWDAVAKDPTLVVVDYFPVYIGQFAAAAGGGGFGGAGDLFTITGVKTSDKTMKPVTVEVRVPGIPGAAQQTARVKVIGVLSQASSQYYTGMYINRELASQVVPPQMASLLPVSTFFFRVKQGEDPEALRRALGTAFINNGLEPVVISDKIHQQQSVANGLNGLLQGFMALGLLVGVAALGVISTRAVVERRQQIGVLRAIGYQRGMVGMSFLLESSFIALLGIAIGVVLGLILSYNFVQFFAKDTPTVQWTVPWLQIGGIVLLAYVVSLLTTIAPARSAASIYPAEALRYE